MVREGKEEREGECRKGKGWVGESERMHEGKGRGRRVSEEKGGREGG